MWLFVCFLWVEHCGFIAKFCYCHDMLSLCLWCWCVVTKQLDHAVFTARVSPVSIVSLKNEIRSGPLHWRAHIRCGRLTTLLHCRHCTLHTYICCHITSGQPEPLIVLVLCAVNMWWSTAIHCHVQYRNKLLTWDFRSPMAVIILCYT